MSETVTFITSNDVKFRHAQAITQALGVELVRGTMDFQEIQADSGEQIARHKANQAYESLQKPIVVNDDTWIIPALGGFPGPYMSFVNTCLTTDDWLRLTAPLENRQIILRQHTVYQDTRGQKHFTSDRTGVLLTEARGENHYKFLATVSFDEGNHSAAELIGEGKLAFPATVRTSWHDFAEWFGSQTS